MDRKIIERFWSQVDRSAGPDACWPWKRAAGSDRYANFRLDGRNRRAHQVAWEIENGPFPAGMLACHRCDNPPCVNPAHIFPGTAHDNIQDAVAKGRIRVVDPTKPCIHGHAPNWVRYGVRRVFICYTCKWERHRAETEARTDEQRAALARRKRELWHQKRGRTAP